MKKLALILFAILGLAWAARAQQTVEILRLPMSSECLPWKVVNNILIREFDELPFVIAEGGLDVQLPGEIQKVEHKLVIYLNSNDRTYTVVAFFPEDGMACVLSSGINFRPFAEPANGTAL